MKKINIVVINIAISLFTSYFCVHRVQAQKVEKEILYQSFPKLDSVLCILVQEQTENKHNKYIYAHLEHTGNYIYKIYIDGSNDKNIPTGYSQVIKPSNRYLKVCNKKIPVFLGEYDNMFVNPREKNLLPGMIIYHGIIVTFNAVEQKILSIE